MEDQLQSVVVYCERECTSSRVLTAKPSLKWRSRRDLGRKLVLRHFYSGMFFPGLGPSQYTPNAIHIFPIIIIVSCHSCPKLLLGYCMTACMSSYFEARFDKTFPSDPSAKGDGPGGL